MVSKRVMGYSRCGIHCDTCIDNYDKKLKHGCIMHDSKITNPNGIDTEERIKERVKYHPHLAPKVEYPKKDCPKCGANMQYKVVKGYHHDNKYFKCPKCGWFEIVK
jgi:predicted RNA-binding Zn-ribbon protein involved in translation (DUF1610 family)